MYACVIQAEDFKLQSTAPHHSIVRARLPGEMGKGNTQKHLRSRISFLHKAAAHLCGTPGQPGSNLVNSLSSTKDTADDDHSMMHQSDTARDSQTGLNGDLTSSGTLGISRLFVSQLKGVAQKGVIRLTPDMKRAMCKRCDTVLEDGSTSSRRLENASRCGRKPQADVLVITCNVCGAKKRLPVGTQRQARKKQQTGRNVLAKKPD